MFVQSIVMAGGCLVVSAIPENITKLLPSVLLRVRSISNSANGNKFSPNTLVLWR